MIAALRPPVPGVPAPSASDFTRMTGPWIIVATVIIPALIAGWTRRLPQHSGDGEPFGGARAASDHVYRALILPLAEIVNRLKWGAILVLAVILLYRVADSLWAPFAFPFYLDFLGYSNDEVAFASKLFGVWMTIGGVALGGFLLATWGRMPTLVVGGIVAALSNLLYADLALGGAAVDGFAHLFGLDRVGVDPRLMRLLIAICGENIAGGLAGTAFVAYISSITAREYSAVQYALLSSMTFLVGALGRAATGEAIDVHGYATTFYVTAALGGVAVLLVLAEWWRGAARGPVKAAEPVNRA
jgi:MFS transporter, PAT family, beta-lactamase induction signal transducer AmpG